MNRLQIKREITRLLQTKDLSGISTKLSGYPEKQLLNTLFSCLCHNEEIVKWHAVSCFGLVVPKIAEREMETGRTVMRRFLWMLNDESGGIGWGVPEAMAEVMCHHRLLGEEYLHMLVSYTIDDGPDMFQDGNFLELTPLQEGVLWGLWRIAPRYATELIKRKVDQNLQVYFDSDNSRVRGFVCALTGVLQLRKFRDLLTDCVDDRNLVGYYREGNFFNSEVGIMAQEALARL